MNKKRRILIDEISVKMGNIEDELQDILYEEQDSLDNTPENLVSSIRYEEGENAVECIEEALGKIREALESLIEI